MDYWLSKDCRDVANAYYWLTGILVIIFFN